MAFIKAQKIVRDKNNVIVSGSAAVVDSVYVRNGQKNHCKHEVREKLGKVLDLSEDGRRGVFLSPTRGLVQYDANSDSFESVDKDDPRVKNREDLFPATEIHTVFGDSYLLLSFLEKNGLLRVLRNVFTKDSEYKRLVAHILHGILKDGSKIGCDAFLQKSFASYLISDIPLPSLKSDTAFFTFMGSDHVKVAFFKAFVEHMRKTNPAFGRGCYVDSTPLPNDIEDNPFNALCCHGVSSCDVMTRLILVLDEASGLPVWYDIIPGNVLDINTIMNTINEVANTLDIEIESLILDAGYVSKELLKTFHIGTEKTFIGRMPARKGFPFKTLYWEVKDLISKGSYAFVRARHTYFGVKKRIRLFDQDVFAYIYVDKNNALKRFSEYLAEHEDEYAELKMKDKDWYTVKYGYFVLLANKDTSPKALLTDYFCRTEIEEVFKTSKEYLDLLPLNKWTDTTIRGKILHDTIDTIVLLSLRKKMKETGVSTSEIFGRTQSLMCSKKDTGVVTTETPNKQVKQYYNLLGISIPAHIKLEVFANSTGFKM